LTTDTIIKYGNFWQILSEEEQGETVTVKGILRPDDILSSEVINNVIIAVFQGQEGPRRSWTTAQWWCVDDGG